MFNLRFQHATGQLENTTRLGELKREIARVHTLQREREISAAEAMANQE
jgi:large subunit ribosomal protein L29